MTSKVVLFSGGLDSFCLAHLVKPDLLLYFDAGLPEQRYEAGRIHTLAEEGRLPAPLIFDHRYKLADHKLQNETLPFRNLLFITGAFSYGDKVYLGKTASSRHLDKNATFAAKLIDVLKYVSQDPLGNRPGLLMENMEILLPFDKETKSDFLCAYLNTGGSVESVRMTRSCYRPYGKECGQCQSCIRKSIAFVNNDIPIQQLFEQSPTHFYKQQLEEVTRLGNEQVAGEIRAAAQKMQILL